MHCSVAWLVTYLIYSVFSLSLSLFPLLLSLFFNILLVIEAISDVRLVCICSECANFFLSLFCMCKRRNGRVLGTHAFCSRNRMSVFLWEDVKVGAQERAFVCMYGCDCE